MTPPASTVRWLVAFLALAVFPRLAAADVAGSDVPSRRSLAERVLASTVGITCKADAYSVNTGSGVVVSPDGHILTATSVVPPGAREITVRFPGFVTREAVVVEIDATLAVALLKVDAEELPCLPLAHGLPEVGATVYTAGDVENAMLTNGRASYSRGIVSGIYDVPACPEADYAGVAIETTAAVNPGSDGGPLVDETGAVCGVITLGVLPVRWQGTAVPASVLVERFGPLTQGRIGSRVPAAPAAGTPPLRAVAGQFARHLVGLEVERTFPAEVLPRLSWAECRGGIKGFDALPEAEQERRFSEWLAISRVLEVNQLLRRPAAPLTGVVVSPEGHVLTSLFNVGADIASVRRATGKPRIWDARESLETLVGDTDGGLEVRPNPVRKISVILPDGSRQEARILSRHVPLGVALVKIDATDLPFLDLDAAAVSPQVGDDVGVLGLLPGGRPGWTLNAGIVSAPARNRGYSFQTDALLNYGNSGGPVFDRAGNLLGIAAAPIEPDTVLGRLVPGKQLMRWTRAPNSGVGLAARADRIRDALAALKDGKSFERVPGPYLGIVPDEQKAFTAAVVIGRVAEESPAARAGLKPGDAILEFNDVEISGWPEFTEQLAASRPGDRVSLLIQRKASGPRLVIDGQIVETADDFARFKASLEPGQTFTGEVSVDDTRTVTVELEERP